MGRFSVIQRYLKHYFTAPCCEICHGRLTPNENGLCSSCSTSILHLSSPEDPYDEEFLSDLCGQTARLFWGIAPIERAGALAVYQSDTPVTELLVGIKYRQHHDLCRLLGRMLATRFQSRHFFDGIDLIVPVPLSRERFRKRGYNQSEQIAIGVKEITRLPVVSNAVSRQVDNTSQTQLSEHVRRQNVEGIFKVDHPEALDGKHLLIIDDVITTGATIGELMYSIHLVAPRTTFSVLAVARDQPVLSVP